jgi:DNA-binding CsgD family transcriptional regulator
VEALTAPLNAYNKNDIEFKIYTMFNKQLQFTKSECEVVKLLLLGMNTQEMSDARFVGRKATKFHLTSIYKKLKARDKFQALVRILMILNSGLPLGDSWQKTQHQNTQADQESQ